MNGNISRKFLLFWALFISMLASFSITLIFEAHLSDGISIVSGILAGVALFFTGVLMLFDTITDICNP